MARSRLSRSADTSARTEVMATPTAARSGPVSTVVSSMGDVQLYITTLYYGVNLGDNEKNTVARGLVYRTCSLFTE